MPIVQTLVTYSTLRLRSNTPFGRDLQNVFSLACRLCVFLLRCHRQNKQGTVHTGQRATETCHVCEQFLRDNAPPAVVRELSLPNYDHELHRRNICGDFFGSTPRDPSAQYDFQKWLGQTSSTFTPPHTPDTPHTTNTLAAQIVLIHGLCIAL